MIPVQQYRPQYQPDVPEEDRGITPFIYDGSQIHLGWPGAYHTDVAEKANLPDWYERYNRGENHHGVVSGNELRWYDWVPKDHQHVLDTLSAHLNTPLTSEDDYRDDDDAWIDEPRTMGENLGLHSKVRRVSAPFGVIEPPKVVDWADEQSDGPDEQPFIYDPQTHTVHVGEPWGGHYSLNERANISPDYYDLPRGLITKEDPVYWYTNKGYRDSRAALRNSVGEALRQHFGVGDVQEQPRITEDEDAWGHHEAKKITHRNKHGQPCSCTFYKPKGMVKTASKFDWLQKRPDLQTPEGIAWLNYLQRQHGHADPLMPWLTREWKKGRLRRHPGEGQPSGFLYHPEIGDTGQALEPGVTRHWMDWYNSDHPTRRGVDIGSKQFQVPQMVERVNAWDEDMRQRAQDAEIQQQNDAEVLHHWPDGWSLRRLGPQHLDYEGDVMGHCVGGADYQDQVRRGNVAIVSLRDPKGEPHVTAELTPADNHDRIEQLLQEHGADPVRADGYRRQQIGQALRGAERLLQDPALEAARKGVEEGKITPEMESDTYQTLLHNFASDHNLNPQEAQAIFATALDPRLNDVRGSLDNAEIVQIQGKGNEVPKPEYQRRMKDWFTRFPEDTRPRWDDDRPISHIGEITQDPERYDEDDDYGGYGPHGDYGVSDASQRAISYPDVLRSLVQEPPYYQRNYREPTYDPREVRALYEHAVNRGHIPELADHLENFNDNVAMPGYERTEEYMEYPYPGESWEEEPERWQEIAEEEGLDSPKDAYEDHYRNYEQEQADLIDQIPEMGIVNDLYRHLGPHWNEQTRRYENSRPYRPTYSAKIPPMAQLAPYRWDSECYEVAYGLAQKWPHLKEDAGFYVHPTRGPGDHGWNIAPDGTIVDMTATQHQYNGPEDEPEYEPDSFPAPQHPEIIKPTDPEYSRYISWERHEPQAQSIAHDLGYHEGAQPGEYPCPQCNNGRNSSGQPDTTLYRQGKVTKVAIDDNLVGQAWRHEAPIGPERLRRVSRTAGQLMYHVAPAHARENIQAQGLQFGGDDRVYMSPQPSQHYLNREPGQLDVWEINAEGYEPKLGPSGESWDDVGEYYVDHPIPAERLRLIRQGDPEHDRQMRGYARTAAQEPLRYFHSTDAPLKPGDIIDPASVVGRSSGGNENDPWGWSNSWEGYDPNYVYMWDHRMTEKSPDPGGWHPFLEDEHVYEVEPMGEVVQDPEGAALKAKYDETGDENYEPEWYHPYSWAAPQARVVGEVGIDDPVFERARQMRDLQSLSQHSPPSPFTPLPLSDHPNAHPSHARIGTDTVNNGSPSSVNNETTRVPASISRHDERQSHLYHRNGNVTPNTLHGYSPDSANDTHASLASQRAGIKRSIPSDTHRDLWEDDPPYAEGPNKEAHFCAISESPSDIADQIGTSSLERLAWNPFKRQRPLRQNFNAQPWKPGENGKAFFWGGKPYLWSTQGYGPDGRPAHGDMALQLGDPAGITSSAWIDPEGNIKFPYETFEPSPAEEQEAIRQMVEEARGRLGSHKHALFGDGGPEHPDYDRIQHTPGMWGKGVLWPTGAVHTWQTDGEDGLPWHDHYADNNDYPNIKSRWKFEILPGSNKFSTYYPPEPQDQQLIEQKTGLEYTKDPYADWGEDAWNEHNSHKHAYDEFKPWVPGSWGKALTLEDGTPHLWRTEGPGDQFPLHGDYAFAKEIPRQEIAGEFVIHPNGDVMSTGLAKGHFEEVAKRTGGKPIDYMTGWDFNENDWDDDDFND